MQPCITFISPRAEGQSAKKEVCFANKNFVFHFFFTIFFAHDSARCHLQCDCYNLNVKFLIFFKNFYKVHSFEVLSQDPCQQK
jgi:hypothetical protein